MSAPTVPASVTGPAFTIEADGSRAEIGSLAAVLRSLTVHDGLHLTEPFGDDTLPPQGCGMVLVPWPNRVRDGRWTYQGAEQQLDLTEPSRGNATHGLLRNTLYQLVERTAASVTLGATVPPQHGWPFQLETTVHYEVHAEGITVTHGVRNIGADAAPYALGAHPYLRVGARDLADVTVTVPASSYFEADDRLIPTGIAPVDGTDVDLRVPRRIADLHLDTAYSAVTHAQVHHGRGDVGWLTAPDGARTTLWTDLSFAYVQVFTSRIFPKSATGDSLDADGHGLALAMEPMTAPANALNSGDGLIWLEPGQQWSGSWGIRYDSAP